MHISFVHIRNFRKLKECSLDIERDKTILVGPNNSGKTSVIAAFKRFLGDKGREGFVTRDFTLNLWDSINKDIGEVWDVDFLKEEPTINEEALSLNEWEDFLPSFDLWIDADDDEAHLLNSLMAGEEDDQKRFGMRIRLEPNVKRLFNEYRTAKMKAQKAQTSPEAGETVFFPNNLHDFLERGNKIKVFFHLKYYILNPDVAFSHEGGYTYQPVDGMALLESNPLRDLILIDVIYANRQFSDDKPDNNGPQAGLSEQFHKYHTTVYKEDDIEYKDEDIPLLKGLDLAHAAHNKKLGKDLKPLIDSLTQINYPGFHNPSISVDSVINMADTIHSTSIQFCVDGSEGVRLHEGFNGLGYRNLLWMCITLYIFKHGRLHPREARDSDSDIIPPIHLIFIEEPEAHLHAQAQQVFINKIYEMVNAPEPTFEKYKSQLIISTHSNHIVNEMEMDNIRFFKRKDRAGLKISEVINLKNVFGPEEKETEKFVTRYIRLTHCDIYFADAVILVEGPAEKILMKHFLTKGDFASMSRCYVSVIEINGSHAHTFRNLIDRLGVFTLIITDIDAQRHWEELETQKDGSKKTVKKTESVLPAEGKGYLTNNDTIKNWLPDKKDIDELLKLDEKDKCVGNVRIAYQTGIEFDIPAKGSVVRYPYTFEDSLILTNWNLFNDVKVKKSGALTAICNLIKDDSDVEAVHSDLFRKLTKKFAKAEFAVNLLYEDMFDDLACPEYIGEGLKWLENKIKGSAMEEMIPEPPEVPEDVEGKAYEEL